MTENDEMKREAELCVAFGVGDLNNALYVHMIRAIADTIKEVGEAPSGVLYAGVCDRMTLPEYTKVIDMLKTAGLIRQDGSMLVWIGNQAATPASQAA